MSFIVKGLDIPKEGIWYNIDIIKNKAIVDVVTSDNTLIDVIVAEVIEISSPHGRLIDVDELQELYADSDDLDLSNYDVKVAVIGQNIKDMPTILEVED